MSSVSLAGKVQTVLGPIDPDDLGVTMTHEHLLVSTVGVYKEPTEASLKAKFEAPFSIEILGWLLHGRGINKDNSKLDHIPTIVKEVGLYKEFGGLGAGGCDEPWAGSGPGGVDTYLTGHGSARYHGVVVLRGRDASRGHGRDEARNH